MPAVTSELFLGCSADRPSRPVDSVNHDRMCGGGPGAAQDRVGQYPEWVTNTVRQLGN